MAFVLLLALAGCSRGAPSKPAAAAATVAAPARPAISAAPRAQPEPANPPDRQARTIARMLRRVSSARQIEATKTVPGVLLARDALIARVREHVSREVPHEAIRQEGLVLQLLGFVPTRFDYEAETYSLLESELAGFYEPADGTMYMASDLDADNAQATLAHELDHALQDQRWDLAKRSTYQPGQGDKSSAFSALAEGDATSAMADVLLSKNNPGATALDLPEELFNEQIIGSMSAGPTAKVPHVMKTSLVAPYVDGTLFVHALRRKGGWHAVNDAWDNPPVTTEQILHVDKWEAHEPALPVADPPMKALGEGWEVADSDVYGELGLRLALEEWMGGVDAGVNAAGWGGDRGVLLRKGQQFAFAWRMRFDEAHGPKADALASRTWGRLMPALHGKLGLVAARDAQFACVQRPETGPLAVARRGRDLLFLAGPANTSPSGWSSAGRCDKAKAWAEEVFASVR
jgi:hypothetical protein